MRQGLAQPGVNADRRRHWARLLRRYRRVIAAILTGLGVLFAVAALRPPPPIPPEPADPRLPTAGQVALPVELTSASATALLQVGDQVDVVMVAQEGSSARILARDVTVLMSAVGGSFVGANSGTVLLGMSEAAALQVAGASGAVTVLLRGHR